jgi:REP element-mobilizing transposase RayT
MATHTLRSIQKEVYFVTFTCNKWMPLIEQANAYHAFNKWFDYLPSKNIKLLGYVIMPNHFHTILAFDESATISLNALIANAKRFLAYEIIKLLEQRNNQTLLLELYNNVTISERKRGKKHKVFKTSFDSVVIKDKEAMEKILTYIHNNPCNKKWRLVSSPEEYPYSSISFYKNIEPNKYLYDYRNLF